MQTVSTGCSKAEPEILPCCRPPSQGRGTAKIWSGGDGHRLYLQTQFGEDPCTQFRVIVVTDTQRKKLTNRQTDMGNYNTPQLR